MRVCIQRIRFPVRKKALQAHAVLRQLIPLLQVPDRNPAQRRQLPQPIVLRAFLPRLRKRQNANVYLRSLLQQPFNPVYVIGVAMACQNTVQTGNPLAFQKRQQAIPPHIPILAAAAVREHAEIPGPEKYAVALPHIQKPDLQTVHGPDQH